MTPWQCSGRIKNTMNKLKVKFTLIIAIVLVTMNVAYAQFGQSEKIVSSKMFLSVDKLRPGDTFELAVKATVKKDYHVGGADKDALYPANLSVSGPKFIKFDAPAYPKSVRKAFPFAPDEKIPVYEDAFVIKVKGRVDKDAKLGSIAITSKLDTQACKDDQCFPPELTESELKVDIVTAGTKVNKINQQIFAPAAASVGSTQNAADKMVAKLANMSWAERIIWLYIGGLFLAFTPCVYPMIPVTVGYFSNQGHARKRRVILLAAMYVLGLALTYATLGAVAAATGGIFGAVMQSPGVLVGIAVILVALALSMFGLYELQAPTFIQNRASGKSGVLGALIMGLIFGIVAAPCVGPAVIALLLLIAYLGVSPATGFLLFFIVALGIGTPLFFLAAFSAKMPVPGMWMVTVKKAAGFLLIGAAAHFIRTLVPEPISGYLIPAVIVIAGIYLGFFEKSIRTGRAATCAGRVFGVASLAVAMMMVMPSIQKAPQKTPMKWQTYSANKVTQAAEAGKPVMIDFTAEWCGVCKELEHGALSDAGVKKAAQRFERLRVDGTTRSSIVKAVEDKYGIKGYPAIIFIDSSGQEVKSARIVENISAEEMVRRIESVK